MDPEIRRLRAGFQRTFRLTDAVTASLMMLMTVVIMARVFNRWFQLGLSGQGEMAQIIMIWIVFLNIAGAAYADRDIKSEFMFDQLPDRARYGAKILITAICFVVVFALFSSTLSIIGTVSGRTTTSLSWPMSVLYIPLAVGSGLLLMVYGSHLLAFGRDVYRRVADGGLR